MKNYGYFGKLTKKISFYKDARLNSKAMGMRDTKEINMAGRLQLDMYMEMHRSVKLSAYSLNAVSKVYLG